MLNRQPEPHRKVRVFSRKDQERASKKAPETTLSANEPSYNELVVDLGQHFARVRIVISPFRRLEYPGHVFFTSSTRYRQCCSTVNPKSMEDKVKKKVDAILRVHYPQVSCDLNSADAFSATEQPSLSVICRAQQAPPSPNDQNLSEETFEQEVESIVTLLRNAIKLRISNEARPPNSDTRARKSTLRSSQLLSSTSWVAPPLPQFDKNQVASYDQFVELIDKRCSEFEKTSKELATTLKFIAGCILELSPYLPPILPSIRMTSDNCQVTKSRAVYWEWRGRALMTNAIVNGLLPSWGRWAHLLYDTLGATSSWFRPLRKLAHPKLLGLASEISAKLIDDPGPRAFESLGNVDEKDVFDPEEEIANLLNLPSTVTRHRLLPHLPANLSLERTFNRQTTLQLTRPYDWAIFTAIYNGNVGVVINLLQTREASTTDVDPYGLGLFYYASYYCYKNLGLESSMQMCQALVRLEVPVWFCDEIGNSGWETMIDNALISRAAGQESNTNPHASICLIAGLCGRNSTELWEEYISTRGFSRLHEALLDINQEGGTLSNRLANASQDESLVNTIDQMDSRGRTPLAWAVEYGWEEAVALLLQYGADPHQLRPSLRGESPLLQLAIAGSNTTHPKSSLVGVIKVLVEAGVDVNAPDHEGWTALHVAASWQHCPAITALSSIALSSLREINWLAQTGNGKTAADLSLDTDFYPKMIDLTSSMQH